MQDQTKPTRHNKARQLELVYMAEDTIRRLSHWSLCTQAEDHMAEDTIRDYLIRAAEAWALPNR